MATCFSNAVLAKNRMVGQCGFSNHDPMIMKNWSSPISWIVYINSYHILLCVDCGWLRNPAPKGCLKPYKSWDVYHRGNNWCRISQPSTVSMIFYDYTWSWYELIGGDELIGHLHKGILHHPFWRPRGISRAGIIIGSKLTWGPGADWGRTAKSLQRPLILIIFNYI